MPRQPVDAGGGAPLPDGELDAVVRRAPFSDNPRVGARGQRARQRILDAALRVFDEDGYHRCGVARITEVAGCSRAAFYQYFASKEDVFRHLAGQVARQLTASAEALGPVTPDADGWGTLREWVGRHADIYQRYEPVFRAYQAAAESDEAVASGASRIGERNVANVRARLDATDLPARHLDAVIALLLECMTRTHHVAGVLRLAVPEHHLPERVADALTDVVHRTFFGRLDDVNVHRPARRRPPRIELGPVVARGLADGADGADGDGAGAATNRTHAALVAAARQVLVARGYHGTRVDDIAEVAGVSHGAFYRYFDNKDHLVGVLGVQAMRTVSRAFDEIPDVAGLPADEASAALRRWLRRYNTAHAAETAMIRVWVDAAVDHPSLGVESAAPLDWGRRRLVRFLRPRGFGDVDTEAVVMVSLLDAYGARRRAPSAVDAAAHIIERGLLGTR